MNINLLSQILLNGIIQGALLSLLAIGFGLIYRSIGFFDLSYGALYTVSAYLMYLFFQILNLNFLFSLLLSFLGIFFLSSILEKGVYLKFYRKNASPLTLMVASLGIYIILENTIALIFGNEIKIMSTKIEPVISIFNLTFSLTQAVQFTLGILLSVMIIILVKTNKYFKSLWALGDEPELIEVLNLPFYRFRLLAFLSASFFACTASILSSFDVGMNPHGGLNALLSAAIVVMIGGIDSIRGWILSAYLLALLQSLIIIYFNSKWVPLVSFGLLIIILITKPQGIFGLKKRLEE